MVRLALAAVMAGSLAACGAVTSTGFVRPGGSADARADAIARAQVWRPTDIPAMNLKTGPMGDGAFPFRATITCDYTEKDLSGASPKFACRLAGDADDELKVKYGGTNAEVYAEVAATRLLWALGFGADRIYSVRVICRGCPKQLAGIARPDDEWVFDPATVERKMPAPEFPGDDSWHWRALESVNPDAGGAPRAHRDALKLLAVFLQHTDSKPEQQRLVCLDGREDEDDEDEDEDTRCERPFMMVNDVGLTFGRANTFNDNEQAMNLVAWSSTPVWKADAAGCVGNLPKSFTGTLDNPVISEEGRAFLAGLLDRLTDAQLRDLFEGARVTLRPRDPANARSGFATVDEWVDAFKQKRREIAGRRCA